MNRKYLSLAALVFVLVGVGIMLMPFSADGGTCSPSVVSAWQTQGPLDSSLGLSPAAIAVSGYSPSAPTDCAKKGRYRLETAGVLLGLTAIGWLVGSRILRPTPVDVP